MAYIDRYMAQVEDLRRELDGHTLHCIWGEGDSVDGTRAALESAATQHTQLIDVTCNGPKFGSVVSPERFAQLATIWNKMLDCIPDDADAVVIVESDLIWTGKAIAALVHDLDVFPVVGGMVWNQTPQTIFYDIWAYRQGGERFNQTAPWFPQHADSQYVKVDSIGSVVAMRGKIAQTFRLPPADVLVGYCNQIRGVGGSIWVDRKVDIVHP